MSTIVTRAGKGAPLTHNEVDANFNNLNTDKVEKTAAAITGGSINGTTIGASTPSTGSFTSLTDSGNLTFTGTGNRIIGDFSNATVSNRVSFQTSTVNTYTDVCAIPSGTGTQSQFSIHNSSSSDNASRGTLLINASELRLQSGITGTGTYLPLTMYTGGSERLRIDTSGNVGIGSSSPSARFEVRSNTDANSNIAVFSNDSTGASSNTTFVIGAGGRRAFLQANYTGQYFWNSGISLTSYFQDYDTQIFRNNAGTERMRIDSSGNVGIGSSSPAVKLDVAGSLRLASVADILANTTGAGSIAISAGTSYNTGGTIVYRGSTNATNPYGLEFNTGGSERMRIDSSGNLLVNKTSAGGYQKLCILYTSGSDGASMQHPDSSGATNPAQLNFLNSAGTRVGYIASNGTATTYSTSSDYRLKENVVPMTGALNKVAQLKPVTYDWKDGGSSQGFIAHELQTVIPEAVVGEKDAVDKEGNPKYQGIDTSFLTATLSAAIQELHAIVKAQAVEIAELKAKI